jgi:hypothetical protein
MKSQGWPLQKITNPISIEYTDGSSITESKIWYMVDLRICAAGVTVVMGALITRLKSFKHFLGFDWLQAVNPQINWQHMTVETRDGQEPLEMGTTQEGPGPVPNYIQLYLEVFSEEGFEDLPPRRPWDHTIDLVEGLTPPHRICYPLSRHEQEELKRFIETNQKARKIWPSTSHQQHMLLKCILIEVAHSVEWTQCIQ